MKLLYTELTDLLAEFAKDREKVTDNKELLLGYADDFYSLLVRIKEKLDIFLFDD